MNMKKKISPEIANLIAYIVTTTESCRYTGSDDTEDVQIMDETEYEEVVKVVDELASIIDESDEEDLVKFVEMSKKFVSEIKLIPKKFYAISQEKAEAYDKKLRDITDKYDI